MADITVAQLKAISIIPRVTASLSIVGSCYIIFSVVRDKKKRNKPYHRLVLGLSCADVVSSTFLALSTWPIPAGTPGVYGAGGTQTTCNIQGVFLQCGIAIPLYNGSLSLYYLLVISYNWREERLRKVEPWLHCFPVLFGFATAITALPLDLYNSSFFACWLASHPNGCHFDENVPCVRGEWANFYGLGFYVIPLWSTIFFGTGAMIKIYCTVRRQERASSRWRVGSNRPEYQLTRRVAWQAFFYLSTFLVIFVPSCTVFASILLAKSVESYPPYPVFVMAMILFPLQGAGNVLVYMLPRYLNPESTVGNFGRALRRSMISFRRDTRDTSTDNSSPADGDLAEVVNFNEDPSVLVALSSEECTQSMADES